MQTWSCWQRVRRCPVSAGAGGVNAAKGRLRRGIPTAVRPGGGRTPGNLSALC